MVVEFSPRCDGCHTTFKEGGDTLREPVSVGCFHTVCRACAQGDKGAYGALQHLGDERGCDRDGEGEAVSEAKVFEVDPRVKALVHGRCGVCGEGDGEIVLQGVVLEALRCGGWEHEEEEREGEGEGGSDCGGKGSSGGGDRPEPEEEKMCEVCGDEGEGGKHLATHVCENCNEFMCDVMARGHRGSKASSDHVVKESEGAKLASPLCPTHQQPFLPLFCKEDRCLVCTECVATDHRGHTCAKVEEELEEELKKWLAEDVAKAEAKARQLEDTEAAFLEDRDKVTACVRESIASINAVFDELEKKRGQLIEEVVSVRKGVCQRLNDVRTTARLLRQGVEAAQRALLAHDNSPSFLYLQRVDKTRQQLRRLVEESKAVRTHRGDTVAIFRHNEDKLKLWGESVRVEVADASSSGGGVLNNSWVVGQGVQSQSLPSLAVGRECLGAAVVAASDSVFVVGGLGSDGDLNTVEKLEAGSGAWEGGLTIPTPRHFCGACAVGSAVVVVGGYSSQGNYSDAVEAVDTVSGAHTTLPPLPCKVEGCGVASVQGRVIVTGGFDGASNLSAAWALDLGSDANLENASLLQWTALPSLAHERAYHGAAAGGGCVFVCGGFNGGALDSCEMLRVEGGGDGQARWEPLPPLPAPRRFVGCCYGGGHVFVVGGNPGDQRSVFAFAVAKREWTRVAELSAARRACAVVCAGRRVLVLGGHSANEPQVTCEAFEF